MCDVGRCRGILAQTPFDSSYTAMTLDGVQWLVQERSSVKLVGIDALSIAVFDDLIGPHEALLEQVRPQLHIKCAALRCPNPSSSPMQQQRVFLDRFAYRFAGIP
jgi:hypothetical protein